MSQLKLTADSGGGTVAIKAPASTTGNAALELTVPGTASTTLDSLNRAGNILQVIQHTTSTQTTNTTTSFIDTGLSGSITTINANSKILVMVAQNFYISSNTSSAGGGIHLNRIISGTEATLEDGPRSSTGPYGLWMGAGNNSTNSTTHYSKYNFQYLDSPNQAANTAITYKTKMAVYEASNGYTIAANIGANIIENGTSYLTLMEVAA